MGLCWVIEDIGFGLDSCLVELGDVDWDFDNDVIVALCKIIVTREIKKITHQIFIKKNVLERNHISFFI